MGANDCESEATHSDGDAFSGRGANLSAVPLPGVVFQKAAVEAVDCGNRCRERDCSRRNEGGHAGLGTEGEVLRLASWTDQVVFEAQSSQVPVSRPGRTTVRSRNSSIIIGGPEIKKQAGSRE